MRSFLAGVGATLGALLLGAAGVAITYDRSAESEYSVVAEMPSPAGVRKAVLYTAMGGGAAGWCQQYVAIMPMGVALEAQTATDHFSYVFSASCRSEIAIQWRTDIAVKIGYTIDQMVRVVMVPRTPDGVVAIEYESRA